MPSRLHEAEGKKGVRKLFYPSVLVTPRSSCRRGRKGREKKGKRKRLLLLFWEEEKKKRGVITGGGRL